MIWPTRQPSSNHIHLPDTWCHRWHLVWGWWTRRCILGKQGLLLVPIIWSAVTASPGYRLPKKQLCSVADSCPKWACYKTQPANQSLQQALLGWYSFLSLIWNTGNLHFRCEPIRVRFHTHARCRTKKYQNTRNIIKDVIKGWGRAEVEWGVAIAHYFMKACNVLEQNPCTNRELPVNSIFPLDFFYKRIGLSYCIICFV